MNISGKESDIKNTHNSEDVIKTAELYIALQMNKCLQEYCSRALDPSLLHKLEKAPLKSTKTQILVLLNLVAGTDRGTLIEKIVELGYKKNSAEKVLNKIMREIDDQWLEKISTGHKRKIGRPFSLDTVHRGRPPLKLRIRQLSVEYKRLTNLSYTIQFLSGTLCDLRKATITFLSHPKLKELGLLMMEESVRIACIINNQPFSEERKIEIKQYCDAIAENASETIKKIEEDFEIQIAPIEKAAGELWEGFYKLQ